MPASNGVPTLIGAPPKVQRLQKAIRIAQAKAELRELQELVLEEAHGGKVDATQLCLLVRAYRDLRESIRIELGMIKPGSRNVSVKEEPKGGSKRQRPHRESLGDVARAMGLLPAIDVSSNPVTIADPPPKPAD